MSSLERGYRRLLAWYPQPFRREQEDEILAVLMASAREGQRRPRLADAVDLLKSALRMRLRPTPSKGWIDALAMLSVAVPVFLLLEDILQVAWPYRIPGGSAELGGLSLFRERSFDIAVGFNLLIVALVLPGLRRLAATAIVAVTIYSFLPLFPAPGPLDLFSIGVTLLAAAALVATPGPRYGRHLMNWGHWVALLLTAIAVHLSEFGLETTIGYPVLAHWPRQATTSLVISVALAVVVVILMVVLKANRYYPLLLLALLYPSVLNLVLVCGGNEFNTFPLLIRLVIYLQLLLLGYGAAAMAVLSYRGRRPAATLSAPAA
jgi:hypothetical protein